MLNLIQKIHALILSDKVNIWHFPAAKGKSFVFWLTSEPDNKDGHEFATFEEMIEAAYSVIDPLRIQLPEQLETPPQARLNMVREEDKAHHSKD